MKRLDKAIDVQKPIKVSADEGETPPVAEGPWLQSAGVLYRNKRLGEARDSFRTYCHSPSA